MSIPNNLLAKFAMQDIISINSTKATKLYFNTLFDIKSIVNFYTISFSSFLAC